MKRGTSSVCTHVVAAAAIACLTVFSLPAVADSHEEGPPPYSIIHFDDVGPGNATEYEQNAKEWVAAFAEAKAGVEWAWRTYSGPNFQYAFVTDVPNYAYLDGDEARWAKLSEVIGAEKIERLSAGGGSNGHSHEMVKRLPELSYMPKDGMGDYGFVRLSRHTVKSGMGEQFKAAVGKAMEATRKAGGPMAVLVSEVRFGTGNYQFVTVAKDAASFYAAPGMGQVLAQAYGPEKAQELFDEWRGCISNYETSDWQFRPDLSYMPGMAGDAEMKEETGGSPE